ncbi:MAG TPA: DUF998 domain-containing protein [Streptosporangiaceae bacterium]|nr:DUF998 domain-containing protein [Streptosporangiaceae bacterium]
MSDSVTRWLLRCGVVAGPVFIAAFLVDGATRSGYRPRRHPVSSLALGNHGWTQVTNFAVTGALYAAGAAGLARAGGSGPRLAGAAAAGATAAGLLGAAAFTTDPVSGYPPGSPDAPERPSREGTAHNLMSTGVFLGMPAAALAVAARALRNGQAGWGLYSAGTAVSVLATTGAAGAGFGQSPRLVGVGGLFQRISIMIGFTWLTALAGRSLRELGPAARSR